MNPSDDQIEAALRRRPSDERVYAKPLVTSGPVPQVAAVVRGSISRSPGSRSPVLAMASLCLILAAGAWLLMVGFAVRGPAGSSSGSTSPSTAGATGSAASSASEMASASPSAIVSAAPRQLSASVPAIALTGRIACERDQPGFTPDELTAALASPSANVDSLGTPMAVALRAKVASMGTLVPRTGWVLVLQSSSYVALVAPADAAAAASFGTPYYGAAFSLRDGSLVLSTLGPCHLRAAAPDGYDAEPWSLDPASPASLGATDLHILVTDPYCHDQAISGGWTAINAVARDAAVTITAFARIPTTAQSCSSSPPMPVVIHLGQPFASVTLLDGMPWPTATVAVDGVPVASPNPSGTPKT